MKRTEELIEMMDYCDQTICIELFYSDGNSDSNSNSNSNSNNNAEKGYKGTDIFEVMLSLGLDYDEDMGCFNCFNGHLNLFRVSSNTFPLKRFDLDVISSPTVLFKDLTFECFIPHCKYPMDTLQSMYNAANYTQKRLGGIMKDYDSGEVMAQPQPFESYRARSKEDSQPYEEMRSTSRVPCQF